MSNSNDLKKPNIEVSPIINSAEKKDPDDPAMKEASVRTKLIDKEESSKDVKIKKKKKKVIQLELGQFIEIESQENDDLTENILH